MNRKKDRTEDGKEKEYDENIYCGGGGGRTSHWHRPVKVKGHFAPGHSR
jgi:hypothetical protein